jgi:hypothetical protein
MATYKTLVIAPSNTGLEYANDEVMAVVNALDAQLLTGGRANIYGLVDILNEGWEIIWLCTHGDETGVKLTDGVVKTSELTTFIRSAGAQLTVFNTCSSYEIAHAIHAEVGTAFVCTVKPLPDRDAFLTGTIFARQLAKGLPFRQAYEAAKPGQNSTYVFLGDREQLMPPNERPQRVEDELSGVKDSLRRIEAIVSGNPQWNVYGLVPDVRDLKAEVRDLRNKVEQLLADIVAMRANQMFNRRMLIFLSVICSGLLVTVVILITQRGPL